MNFKLSESVYNALKWFTLIALPAFSSLYFGMAGTWDLPNAENVVGSIALLTTFLGSLLGISTKNYNASDDQYAGDIEVSKGDGGRTIMALALNDPPADFPDRKKLVFKVVHTDDVREGFAE